MSTEIRDDDADEPWIIPLHGIEAPGEIKKPKVISHIDESPAADHLYADDELPTLEFRPRLRRSA